MLRSVGSESKFRLWTRLASLGVFSLLALFIFIASASAQDFTLAAAAFSPEAVAPGGTSTSNITIVAGSGFVGPVTLTCTVTPSVQITSDAFPVCNISPSSLSGSGGASATITTSGTTPQVGYSITISGTDSSGTQNSQALSLTVLAVTAEFTITVQSAVAPSSVVAGNGAQGLVNINPINGYNSPTDPNDATKSGVYLSCGTITPLVTIAPICSFNPPHPEVKGTTVSSTLTISTYGPVPTGAATRSRNFYALWLTIPILGLVGIGGAMSDRRSRKIWAMLGVFVLTAAFLLLPACSTTTSTPSTSTPNGTTPANTYTFTIIGVDTSGVVSSNTGTNSTGPTVTLAVTAPK
jgi:hypothetical protein